MGERQSIFIGTWLRNIMRDFPPSASPLGASGEGALRPASRPSVPTEQAGGPVVGWSRHVSEEEMRYIEAEVRQCREAERLGLSRRIMDVSPETIAALSHTACELTSEVAFLRAELERCRDLSAPPTASTAEQVGEADDDTDGPGSVGGGQLSEVF